MRNLSKYIEERDGYERLALNQGAFSAVIHLNQVGDLTLARGQSCLAILLKRSDNDGSRKGSNMLRGNIKFEHKFFGEIGDFIL